jgi:hypothetical protein
MIDRCPNKRAIEKKKIINGSDVVFEKEHYRKKKY